MKYKIILQRLEEFKDVEAKGTKENSTIGELNVCEIHSGINKSIWKCYTCENDGPSTDTPNNDKRIVARSYNLEWTDSARNGALSKKYPQYKVGDRNKAIWLTCDSELPSFRGRRILIHLGNYPQDTKGCILLGKTKGRGTVSNSTDCIKDFYELIEKIGIENCTLEVKEIKN